MKGGWESEKRRERRVFWHEQREEKLCLADRDGLIPFFLESVPSADD